jgi:hypothetical protein
MGRRNHLRNYQIFQINGISERNVNRRNMKADEGEFLDRINKINMIFEEGIQLEKWIS